jgi:hypothetical protein
VAYLCWTIAFMVLIALELLASLSVSIGSCPATADES